MSTAEPLVCWFSRTYGNKFCVGVMACFAQQTYTPHLLEASRDGQQTCAQPQDADNAFSAESIFT